MDALLSIIGSILVETGNSLCGSIYPKIKNTVKFNSNVKTLQEEMKSLLDMKKRYEEEIELAERHGKIQTIEVSIWLRKVVELELRMNLAQEEVKCCLPCKLGEEVVGNLKELKQLKEEGSFEGGLVMMDNRVKAVEQLPGPSIMAQEKASEIVANVMNMLTNERIGIIGIWGMGGIGKTTLMRNLNNQLGSSDETQPFGVVIWVTVSKDLDMRRVQNRIAERLDLMKTDEEDIDNMAIRIFERLKLQKKFLLILDDVWERIDLDKIGVPRPKDHTGNKIILTTRSMDVCREMETDWQLNISVLSDKEAWELFGQSAGQIVELERIRPFAADVAKECGGLPLAIITVGRAMRGKTKVELWKDALSQLRMSSIVPSIKGMEKEVFLPLKWSYDSLEGKNIKPCFLYCCLYAEDFSIEVNELIRCWVADGLIDEQERIEESYNRGIALIENLKDSCMLECGAKDGTVRMHDVIRDVAVWIASNLEDGNKSLVRSGMGLDQIQLEITNWKSIERVSFINSTFVTFPACVLECSKVSTFVLQGNAFLKELPMGFFDGLRALRVLNLSRTNIQRLPHSLTHSSELRSLILNQCNHLTELPSLRGLTRLQVLDLSGTSLKMFPDGIEERRNLRYLDLSKTQLLRTNEVGVVLGWLSSLKVLNMANNSYELWVQGNVAKGRTTIREMKFNGRQIKFRVSLDDYWEESTDTITDIFSTSQNERTVHLHYVNLSREGIKALLSNPTVLVLYNCKGIMEMWTRISFVCLVCLKTLSIHSCSWTGETRLNDASHEMIMLPTLEVLSLCSVTNLSSISKLMIQLGKNIRIIEVKDCHQLTKLFAFNLLHKLENLEELSVISCDDMTEIVTDCTVPINALPKLQILRLEELPELNSICKQVMPWPFLKRIEVKNCLRLNKLPLSAQHANTIQVIAGNTDWWSQLIWEDEGSKLSLQQYFQPM